MSVVSENMVGEYRPPDPKSKVYREPTPESWPEAQLIFVGGFSGPFSDNHMAHYRGWTVVVSLDTIDKDWGSQAVNTLCFNLPQFIQANSNPDIASTGIPEWFAVKEEAFAAIKSKIDQLVT